MSKTKLSILTSLLAATFLIACSEESSTPQQATSESVSTTETTAAASTPASNAVGDVVQTKTGAVRGETVTEIDKTARIFRGLPYAAPPVGDLRWKAPQPAAAWEGVRDAIEWPNRCPQGESSMGAGGPISDDSLYLNVVTAAETSDDKRPVMVFCHGGCLTSGTGNSTTYNHPM